MLTPGIFSLRSRAAASLAVVALTSTLFAASASAQQTASRWQPWVGCWTPMQDNNVTNGPLSPVGSTAGSAGMLCVVPAPHDNAVDMVTVSNGRVVHSERVSASAEHIASTRDNCPGWESATWSADNHRLLLRSEYICAGTTKVTGSGIFAISSDGDFVQIQGTTIGAQTTSRVVRYQPSGVEIAMAPGVSLSDSSLVRTQPVTSLFAAYSMRTAAAQPVGTAAIAEVSKSVEAPVAIAWINEIGQRYNVDGKELTKLADAGVSPALIDMMVALSYPDKFAVQRNTGAGGGAAVGATPSENRRTSARTRGGDDWDCGYSGRMLQYGYYGNSCFPGYAYGFDPYYSSYGYNPYGYGYYNPYSYYYGYTPVVIVPSNGGNGGGVAGGTVRGRAVKGGGYTAGDRKPGEQSYQPSTSSGSSGAGSSSGSSSSGSSSSGSSGGGEVRTAKPRTPPPHP
jgi:hypothetical protein